jgi:hypothetical protein
MRGRLVNCLTSQISNVSYQPFPAVWYHVHLTAFPISNLSASMATPPNFMTRASLTPQEINHSAQICMIIPSSVSQMQTSHDLGPPTSLSVLFPVVSAYLGDPHNVRARSLIPAVEPYGTKSCNLELASSTRSPSTLSS